MRVAQFSYALVPLALLSASVARPAWAAPLLPEEAPLVEKAAGLYRQELAFATIENGLFLDTYVKAADVALVKSFFAQSEKLDFQVFSGRHPFDVIDHFGEYGDEGNFAGISAVGTAARLIHLKRVAAPEAEIAAAREAAVRSARTWHVYGSIAGPGVIARGVRRLAPEKPGTPPLPGAPEPTIPLFDESGKPNPAERNGALWRKPVAPGYEDWIWYDDTSKDQVSGYALAVVWLWDALHDDPAVPKDVTEAMVNDLVLFARALMKVAPERGIDLCIRDADGRLTRHSDLNPRQVVPEAVIDEDTQLRNGFNAAMALGIIRAAYHVSGDPEIGRYYYEDLVGKRHFAENMAESAGLFMRGVKTNFSNVNMLAISFALIGRVETDPYVRAKLDEALTKQFWDTGDTRDASHVKQGWFDAVYGSYAAKPDPVTDRIRENLSGFQNAPSFNRDVENCDDAEVAAGQCTAIDGVTILKLESRRGHLDAPVTQTVVPMAIRPDSNFQWRTDPHYVNGQISDTTLLNPSGDFLAAYWLARVSDTDTSKNVSPFGRPPLPYERVDPTADAGTEDGDPGAAPPADGAAKSSGCDCASGSPNTGFTAGLSAVAVALGALIAKRRRSAR